MVKYKHLLAWDTMMGSYQYWKDGNQEMAEKDNAPIDVVFWHDDNGKRKWTTFEEVSAKSTRRRIEGIIKILEHDSV
jgi:hypothetical protein